MCVNPVHRISSSATWKALKENCFAAEKLLSERPPLILCEMYGEENRQTLLKVFAKLGYRCEPCGKNDILAQHTK
jgi:hypothetical protein